MVPESLELTWTERCERDAASAVEQQPPDYKRYHQARAASFSCLTGKSVLVVGCNRGEDCKFFVDMGARLVVGIDVMEEIGRNFVNRNVYYIRTSAEQISVESGTFELVFAYATLEHVPDIRRAFREMVRAAAPGGFIYSAAAPLWCARSGPHWGDAFQHVPWPHLRMTVEEVVHLGEHESAAGSANPYYSPELIRYHLTDPRLFNRRRAHEYVDACLAIDGIQIIRNDIEFEEQKDMQPLVIESLLAKGYTTFDLLGLTHMFVAAKLAATNVGRAHTPAIVKSDQAVLQQERNVIREERDALRIERDALLCNNNALLASTSWRITAPLRGVGRLLKWH